MSHNKSQAEQDGKHLGEKGSGRLSDMNEMPCHKQRAENMKNSEIQQALDCGEFLRATVAKPKH